MDIFVAYASVDRDRIIPLAGKLADQGWSVWWDRKIPPGKTFDETIEEALDQAKAVVAVWTDAGVTSRWVRTEAAEGAARGVLVPVLMDDVRLPLAFRRIQVADLTDWVPGQDHAGFTELINALDALIRAEPTAAPLPAEPEDPVERDVLTAQARAEENDWAGVITVLHPLAADIPGFETDHPAAAALLARAHRKREALELYEEAEVLYADGRWQDVVGRFDRILELDPDLQYGTDLKEKAERHLASEQDRRLASDYARATQALHAREWPVAIARYEALVAESSDYRDAAAQLERARAGLAAEHRYRELTEQLNQGRWEDVIAGMNGIDDLAPDFGDPDRLRERAEAHVDDAATEPPSEDGPAPAPGVASSAAVVAAAAPPAGAPPASTAGEKDAAADALAGEPSHGEAEDAGSVVASARDDEGGGPRRVVTKWTVGVVALAALAIVIVGAVFVLDGGDESTATTTASEAAAPAPTSPAPPEDPAAVDAGGVVCVVTDSGQGTIGSNGFNDVAWEGATRAAEDLGGEARVLESAPDADHEHDIVSRVDDGCDLIVTVGFTLAEATLAAAEKNPQVSFAIVDVEYDEPPANLRSLMFAVDEAAFLAGYAAAGMPDTSIVGTFGGMNIPAVTDFMNGFAGGVDHYNIEHGTAVAVLGWDPLAQEGLFVGNFENPDDGHLFGQELVNAGADVVMPVAGPVGLGTSALASELGTFLVIGVDVDQTLADPENARVYLTSVVKRVDNAVYQATMDALTGRHSNEVYVGVLANEGVAIAPGNLVDYAPDELLAEVEQLRQAIIDGAVSVAFGT